MKSQKDMALDHIREFGSITDADAVYEYSIMRLGSVIHLLRKDGHPIKTTMKSGKNKFGKPVSYAVYTLEAVEE